MGRRRIGRRGGGGRAGWTLAGVGVVAAGALFACVDGDRHHPATATGVASPAAAAPQSWTNPAPASLQRSLTDLAASWREPVGIAVADETGGWIAQVDGDSLYPQQSVSKLWTAITILDQVDHGRMQLGQPVVMTPQDRSVFNLPDTREITDQGYQTTVEELLARAISESDNTAFDKLIQLAGGPGAVAARMNALGLDGIRIGGPEREVQSHLAGLGAWKAAYGVGAAFKDARAKLPDATREAAVRRYIDDPPDGATPVGLVEGLAALDRFRLLSPQSTELLIGLMRQARTGPMRLKGGLPAGWSIAHKTGTGQDWKGGTVGINDVGLITAPDGRTYAVAVMMRRTLHPVPERLTFMQAVARAIVDQWQAQTTAPLSPVAVPSGQVGEQPKG